MSKELPSVREIQEEADDLRTTMERRHAIDPKTGRRLARRALAGFAGLVLTIGVADGLRRGFNYSQDQQSNNAAHIKKEKQKRLNQAGSSELGVTSTGKVARVTRSTSN